MGRLLRFIPLAGKGHFYCCLQIVKTFARSTRRRRAASLGNEGEGCEGGGDGKESVNVPSRETCLYYVVYS